MRSKYQKKPNQSVVAIQLNLSTEGFTYQKWGDLQRCKQGDWLVNNNGDIYTIDKEVFSKTYRQLREGIFLKITPVWAEIAKESGSVITKEGRSHYKSGDYLVYNNKDGTDAYCMSAAKFESMYEISE